MRFLSDLAMHQHILPAAGSSKNASEADPTLIGYTTQILKSDENTKMRYYFAPGIFRQKLGMNILVEPKKWMIHLRAEL